MNKALLLIDIQNDYFPGGRNELVNSEDAAKKAQAALASFRKTQNIVIHVQHINIRKDATFFLPDTNGVKFNNRVEPKQGEFIVVKNYPNSFFNTNLLTIIKENNISELIVCGMMTHMCVDSTVRAAKEFNLKVTLLHDACATKDLQFGDEFIPAVIIHESFMAALSGAFANIISIEELII